MGRAFAVECLGHLDRVGLPLTIASLMRLIRIIDHPWPRRLHCLLRRPPPIASVDLLFWCGGLAMGSAGM